MTDTLEPGPRLVAGASNLRRIKGGGELRFERRLRHSPETARKALTTGDGLACWLAQARIELRSGGRMDLNARQPAYESRPETHDRRLQADEVLAVRPSTGFETFGRKESTERAKEA